MSDHKFKVGQIVRCIEPAGQLHKDNLYRVTELRPPRIDFWPRYAVESIDRAYKSRDYDLGYREKRFKAL